jgi:broad specificity polyphosphatase/5'/3'-nucleotidase SurE
VPYWEHAEDTDISAVEAGYVSITPVYLDFTNHGALDMMKKKFPAFHSTGKPEEKGP